jgi:enoyl-CoA hydratase/3-hydroxyacyl-CoA dehydrogenase
MFVFKAAVVGAGAAGGEIAQVIAAAGIPVLLMDADSDSVDAGLARAREVSEKAAAKLVAKGKLSDPAAAAQVEGIAGLITGAGSYEGFGDVDLVIEAVPERLERKHRVFADLDAATPGHAILASSTSSLSITEIGEITLRPDKVVGLHFVGGRVVEVVEGDDTSPETAQAAANFAQQIRRSPIRCAEGPGFVVNRILGSAAAETGSQTELSHALHDAYGDRFHARGDSTEETAEERSQLKAFVESCLVLEDGVAGVRDIDMALMLGAGMAPGPFVRADLRGLDEMLAALDAAEDAWGEHFEPPLILRRLVAQGRLGAKSGQGFYPYPQIEPGYESEPVKLDLRGDVAVLWLDNPPANSLSPATIEALARAWGDVVERGTRAMVLASPNPALFCAGADIKAFTTWDVDSGREHLERIHALGREWERSQVTTIAAVNGLAFGGGCEIAMACDVRLASRSATFGQPEVNLGILPGFGGTQRLARLVGPAKALEMNTVGDPISAEEAYEYGLVNRVVEDHELFDLALAWGRKQARQAPVAIEQIKRVSHAADLDAGLAAERDAFLHAFASEDAREGISAFIEKRLPEFKGK